MGSIGVQILLIAASFLLTPVLARLGLTLGGRLFGGKAAEIWLVPVSSAVGAGLMPVFSAAALLLSTAPHFHDFLVTVRLVRVPLFSAPLYFGTAMLASLASLQLDREGGVSAAAARAASCTGIACLIVLTMFCVDLIKDPLVFGRFLHGSVEL